MSTDLQSTPPETIQPAAVLHLRSVGQQTFSPNSGNVTVKLERQGAGPYIIMLPYTADEARHLDANHWAAIWRAIRAWPGAPGLKQEQWLLLWTLCRALFWFAQPNNGARATAWPEFMKTYLLLGEVGRHFTFTRPIREDLLLRFLHTWVRERIPEVFSATFPPGIELPDSVMEKANQVRPAKRARRD